MQVVTRNNKYKENTTTLIIEDCRVRLHVLITVYLPKCIYIYTMYLVPVADIDIYRT